MSGANSIGKALAVHIRAGDATLSFDIRILIVANLKKPMKSDELARFIKIDDMEGASLYIIIYKPHFTRPHAHPLALLTSPVGAFKLICVSYFGR